MNPLIKKLRIQEGQQILILNEPKAIWRSWARCPQA